MTQQRMWGADADALEALARDMQNASNRLDSISRQLTARLMSSAWDGGDADRFRADWNRKYRGQLRGSVEFLRQAQGHLSSSGAAQRGASQDGGGLTGGVFGRVGTGDLGGGPRTMEGRLRFGDFWTNPLGIAWGTLRETAEEWSALTAPILGLGVLTRGAATMGRYTNAYRPLAYANDFFKYKRSPVLQFLAPLGGAADSTGGLVKQIIDNPAFRAANDAAGKVGTAAGYIDVASNAFDLVNVDATEDGGDLVRDVADTAASALKASKNPVSYLAGVNVSIWSDVVETGTAAIKSGDMTLEGLPSPFSRDSFTNVYLPAAKDVGSQLGSMWKKWF